MGARVVVESVRKAWGSAPEAGEGAISEALAGVSFSLAPGDFVALLGPSGCGKSTLLNLLGALDRPTAGQYFLDGVARDAAPLQGRPGRDGAELSGMDVAEGPAIAADGRTGSADDHDLGRHKPSIITALRSPLSALGCPLSARRFSAVRPMIRTLGFNIPDFRGQPAAGWVQLIDSKGVSR